MKKKQTSITFIIPGRGTKPVGGIRVVYEYANRLTQKNLTVNIVHVACLLKSHSLFVGLGRYIFCIFFFRFYKRWFVLDPKVNIKWVFIPLALSIPDADFIVATSWETSEYVTEYPTQKGKKLYLIQGNESEFQQTIEKGWQARVQNTWNLPLHKITVSTWLSKIITHHKEQSQIIFNGTDTLNFFSENKSETRNPLSIMMLYHNSPAKGTSDGIAALRKLKSEFENLHVILFGVPPRPVELEEWFHYYRQPNRKKLRELYNQSAIFLSPSHSEGWGLPVIEAMLCGCAILTSDIGGFNDFMIPNETGLCFKVKDIDDLEKKLVELINNTDLRVRLANSGKNFVKRFSWEIATDQFLVLTKSI